MLVESEGHRAPAFRELHNAGRRAAAATAPGEHAAKFCGGGFDQAAIET